MLAGQLAGMGENMVAKPDIGVFQRIGEILRRAHDLANPFAAEQGRGTAFQNRAGMLLAGGDDGNAKAFVAAEFGATDGIIFDLAATAGRDRPHPAGQVRHRSLGQLGAEIAGKDAPAGFPAIDVAGIETGEPAAKAKPDEALGSGKAFPDQPDPAAALVVAGAAARAAMQAGCVGSAGHDLSNAPDGPQAHLVFANNSHY